MVSLFRKPTYSRRRITDEPVRDSGPYEALVVNNIDPAGMGTLEVEILRYRGSGSNPEREGQLITARYLSPFFVSTAASGANANPGAQNSQSSAGFWGPVPEVNSRVLIIMAEGHAAYTYWIGCIQDDYMNFTVPSGGFASTELTSTDTPGDLSGLRLPVNEYNKLIEDGGLIDPTLFAKPYNKDKTAVLQNQGLLLDEHRGTTTSSARRESPSMVFGFNTLGPADKRDGSPTHFAGEAESKAQIPYNRLGGSSFVMDDGDDKFIRVGPAAECPPLYINKEAGEEGGDVTIPQNELMRLRTRTGHQILLHNSEDLIYIGNARGTTWLEMTSDGKIDIHAQDSVSIMTNNDLNITAERDINFEAGRNINMRATARYTEGKPKDVNGSDSGRVQIESMFDLNVISGQDGKILVARDYDVTVGRDYKQTTAGMYNIFSGRDNRLTTGGTTHIHSALEHRETARYIHMNGPTAGQAAPADSPSLLPTITLPFVYPGANQPVEYESILARAPQHEPWPHHENLDPRVFKKRETDRENPGSLPTIDRILTPDTFQKNRTGGRANSVPVNNSGGSINSSWGGERAGGPGSGTGQTPVPRTNYSPSIPTGEEEFAALSGRYESNGDYTAVGFDPGGGPSWGKWQIATYTGTFANYMTFLRNNFPETYSLLETAGGAAAARAGGPSRSTSGTPRFRETWFNIMTQPQHQQTQYEFIRATHYEVARRKIIESTGIDVGTRSNTLNQVLWSTANGHGATGANRVFSEALSATGSRNPSDEAWIIAIYDNRNGPNDTGTRWYGRQPSNIRSAVVNRYFNEEADALTMLTAELSNPSNPVLTA
jgi:hypothetical protein